MCASSETHPTWPRPRRGINRGAVPGDPSGLVHPWSSATRVQNFAQVGGCTPHVHARLSAVPKLLVKRLPNLTSVQPPEVRTPSSCMHAAAPQAGPCARAARRGCPARTHERARGREDDELRKRLAQVDLALVAPAREVRLCARARVASRDGGDAGSMHRPGCWRSVLKRRLQRAATRALLAAPGGWGSIVTLQRNTASRDLSGSCFGQRRPPGRRRRRAAPPPR